MVWQLVDPRYYAQEIGGALAPDGPLAAASDRQVTGGGMGTSTALWYVDDSPLHTGELLLWLAGDATLEGFQLSHTHWPHGREHLVEWRRGRGLRLAEVDDGDGPREGANHHGGPRRNRSPLVRYLAEPDDTVMQQLVTYFVTNAAVLRPGHRQSIAEALAVSDGAAG